MNRDSQNRSRSRILSKLRANPRNYWSEKWPDTVPEGRLFPQSENLVSSFQQELAGLGGEVFLEKDQNALIERLFELIQERERESVVSAENLYRQKLTERGILVLSPDKGIDEFEIGISCCEALIALTGGVMVSSRSGSGRKMNVFPPVQIIVAKKSQLVETIEEGFTMIEERYSDFPSQISLISGPSRTADIEKTLVMGAHGPEKLIVLLDLGS
ncbi:LutC/YkgG family protein [Marinilabilia rubra]|uniref:LUD domain-containing protein n=1 Tax=Marinilabilia rubra TaxID=2162893 RepID=A0A2U2BDM0_9BACT|nr:lactate utilization protein [Marinilabilia rubra]PWE01166.1 hypothetical protein DDZ16_01380 [Marinilabilia rubra]